MAKETTEIVILTTDGKGTPWYGDIHQANRGTRIHVHSEPDMPNHEAKVHAWRNCDRNMLRWWRANRDMTTATHFLFLEWDVWCNVDVLKHVPQQPGMLAVDLKYPWRNKEWVHFREIPKLHAHGITDGVMGVAPLAVVQFSRTLLDKLIETKWMNIFQDDLFSELRLPSVVVKCHEQVKGMVLPGRIDYRELSHPRWLPQAQRSGFFHAIKKL